MSDNNLSQKKQKQYEEYVKAVTPVHSLPLNMCKAFFTGGIICVLGQFILNYAKSLGLDVVDFSVLYLPPAPGVPLS